MQSSGDIIGGRLTVNLESGKRRSVSLSADEAYDLMRYAQCRKRKRRKAKSLKQFDMIVCSMREGGMSVPSMAMKLGTSQASVEGAIRRLDSGRYGDTLDALDR